MDPSHPIFRRLSYRAFATRWLVCIAVLFNASLNAVVDANEPPADIAVIPTATSGQISLINDVVPILTKHGCNGGTCHAKAGMGQNGFQLSLLGFEPGEDFAHLVTEGRGRRIFLAAPEQSLVLRKATGQVSHGGGVRFNDESPSYSALLNWIRQGAHNDVTSSPKLVSLKVEPDRAVIERNGQQQLRVIGIYSDQSQRDETKLAIFESNDSSRARTNESGLVQISDIPGTVSIMVRFQSHVTVFHAAVPQGSPVEAVPPSKNFIDDHVFGNLKSLGIPPSPVCDDASFIRRVTLDVAGRIPSQSELDAFQSDVRPDKRELYVDQLLQGGEYADFFANKWTAMLKNRRDDASDIISNFAFYSWIRDGLLANKPYDQMVRELLAATGTVMSNPPVAWYKRVKEPKQQLEDVAQLFLGVRLQCAQCHHHPFERWSQDDYYSLAAFFSQVGRKPTATRGEDMIFHRRGLAGIPNAKTGVMKRPAPLGESSLEIAPDQDPRLKLAEWMSSPTNPFFAKAVVNRYWKHFFRRGLVEPEDDIRDTNPASNPELLQSLEKRFIESGYDLKQLVRLIVQSNAYQLSSTPNEFNVADLQNFSHYYPRRLQAEVLLDAMDDLAGVRTEFPNLPSGTRAISLPDNSYNNASPFLKVFGRPENESVCECERIQSSSLGQSLFLMNANDIKSKLGNSTGRAERLATSDQPFESLVSEIYRIAFARTPTASELSTSVAYVSAPKLDNQGNAIDAVRARRENFQDLLWALMNTKEFLFNH